MRMRVVAVLLVVALACEHAAALQRRTRHRLHSLRDRVATEAHSVEQAAMAAGARAMHDHFKKFTIEGTLKSITPGVKFSPRTIKLQSDMTVPSGATSPSYWNLEGMATWTNTDTVNGTTKSVDLVTYYTEAFVLSGVKERTGKLDPATAVCQPFNADKYLSRGTPNFIPTKSSSPKEVKIPGGVDASTATQQWIASIMNTHVTILTDDGVNIKLIVGRHFLFEVTSFKPGRLEFAFPAPPEWKYCVVPDTVPEFAGGPVDSWVSVKDRLIPPQGWDSTADEAKAEAGQAPAQIGDAPATLPSTAEIKKDALSACIVTIGNCLDMKCKKVDRPSQWTRDCCYLTLPKQSAHCVDLVFESPDVCPAYSAKPLATITPDTKRKWCEDHLARSEKEMVNFAGRFTSLEAGVIKLGTIHGRSMHMLALDEEQSSATRHPTSEHVPAANAGYDYSNHQAGLVPESLFESREQMLARAEGGDGYCDRSLNTAEKNWDGGDCCPGTCKSGKHTCGSGGYDCKQKGTAKCLFLHGLGQTKAAPGQKKCKFGNTGKDVADGDYWGDMAKVFEGLCGEVIYSRCDTTQSPYDDPALMSEMYAKAEEVYKAGGVVFAHSMANVILAGACMLQDKCDAKWIMLGGPVRGSKASGFAPWLQRVIGRANPSSKSLVFSYKGFAHSSTKRGLVASTIARKKLLDGAVCGVSTWGSGRLAVLYTTLEGLVWGLLTCQQRKLGICYSWSATRTDGAVHVSECMYFSYWDKSDQEKFWYIGNEPFSSKKTSRWLLYDGNHDDMCGISGDHAGILRYMRRTAQYSIANNPHKQVSAQRQ